MVRFTTEERKDYEQKAKDMGVPLSTWIRVAAKEKLRN
jgi:hypothetical protein